MEKNYHIYAAKLVELQTLLGRAVAKWANLEACLLSYFAWSVSMTAKSAAQLLIYVKTFSLSLDLTDAAIKERLGAKKELVFWNSLVQYIRELSGTRNFLVHAGIIAHGDGHPDEADWALAVPKIGPSMIDYFAGSEKLQPIDAAELEQVTEDLQDAIEQMQQFLAALQQGASLEKYQQPISRRRPPRKQRQAGGQK